MKKILMVTIEIEQNEEKYNEMEFVFDVLYNQLENELVDENIEGYDLEVKEV